MSIHATPTNNNQVSYSFSGWTGGGAGSYSGTNNPASITMNGPITETAAFTRTRFRSRCRRIWQVVASRLTVLPIPRKRSPGRLVRAHYCYDFAQNGDMGVRYVWTSWSGGGAISHTVTPTTNKTYTANFNTQYFLTMSHGTGGTVTPASAWKNNGTVVSIHATPASGYSFTIWTGSEQALTLARTIRLQSQWAPRSRRRRSSLIIDDKIIRADAHSDGKYSCCVLTEPSDTQLLRPATPVSSNVATATRVCPSSDRGLF